MIDSFISYCRVHDLLRDLAIEKAKEDGFLTVCSKTDEEQSCSGARRVAVNYSDSDGLMKFASSNLRTLLCFNDHSPNCSGHKFLKVLRVKVHTVIQLGSFEGLTQLRYLRLYGDLDVDIDNPARFIKLISGMKFLQTLDLRCINPCDLSDFTWRIETLRHVILPGSLGPPCGAKLRNLQTLAGIRNRESWDIGALPNVPNLLYLRIYITEGFPWKKVVAFLGTLKNLVKLTLESHDTPIEVIDMRCFPFYRQLRSLIYRGKFFQDVGVHLDAIMFPTHLTVLVLMDCVIGQDIMTVLEKLCDLKSLYLHELKDEEKKQMKCSAGGFTRLQYLKLFGPKNLEEWEIEEGAMPVLETLTLVHCPMLQIPLGLKYLTTLRELTWDLWMCRSATTKAKEIRNLCRHVPHLDIRGVP
jgi:hypothetical protein